MKNVCALLLLTCAGTSLALAQGIEGEKWKVTNTMQMGGMSMPGQTSEICKQPDADAEQPPIRTDDNCQIYDMKRSGNVQSFKMRCDGEDKVEGSAQLTYISADHYKGRMEMTTGGETMVMNYEGKKLGQCDGTEANFVAKKILADAERQQKLAEQQMIQRCHDLAAKAEDPFFLMQCKDPADKRTYCEAVRKPENFRRLAQQERRNTRNAYAANNPGAKPLTESARICGFGLEQEREALCKVAEQKNDLNFIATECPIQAAGVAAAQCAGRRYTAIAERYRSFCSEYASNQDEEQRQQSAGAASTYDGSTGQDQPQDAQQEQPQTTGDKAKGLFNKGKKALGGLFSN
ncbi:hypothetical protein GCM10011487_39840 [Steroidobacter agaridevorans]|uniref:DUF3617 family protein n=1 Tax=Steroidobacter agaridevorans TaxID=2695856 RepID=A0A829YFD3_9GAMM|nr:DUF3617 family protein [Steroidobacter agaridevorans]GFE81984.1 hypothetical protein GCM10011487_39840 [Steroidobacter agaridevorans]GFE85627.1 hypothetical protein GCM10011488_05810 [Steroidobacter agaridevorans]